MDWDSDFYQKYAKAQERTARELIETIPFAKNDRVLDIGCGDGKITAYMASQCPQGHVTGIDISPAMIQHALLEFGQIANLEFCQVGAEEFSFAQRFDWIVSFNALHWVKDHQKMLQRVKQALKPGGHILFCMVSGEGDQRLGSVFMKEPWHQRFEQGIGARYHRFTPADYHACLAEMGVQPKKVETIGFSYTFKEMQGLVNHFLTWVPFAMGMSTEESRPLALELAQAIASGQAQDIVYTTKMLVVEAHLPA